MAIGEGFRVLHNTAVAAGPEGRTLEEVFFEWGGGGRGGGGGAGSDDGSMRMGARFSASAATTGERGAAPFSPVPTPSVRAGRSPFDLIG